MCKEENFPLESLRDSCDELFETIPLSLLAAVGRAGGSDLDGRQLATTLGFVGDGVSGSLTIRAPISFFSATRPAMNQPGPLSLREVSDWAGEMANQLLGRLKNKFLGRGVSFSVTTPVVMYGEFLKEAVAADGALALFFRWQEDEIAIRLETRFAAKLALSDPTPPDSSVVRPGEAVVF